MSLAVTSPTSLPAIKMEDRKRPAASTADDVAPPAKRQALVNGSKVVEGDEDGWIEVRGHTTPDLPPLCFIP